MIRCSSQYPLNLIRLLVSQTEGAVDVWVHAIETSGY